MSNVWYSQVWDNKNIKLALL